MLYFGFTFLTLSLLFYWLADTYWRFEGVGITLSALCGLLALICFSMRKDID